MMIENWLIVIRSINYGKIVGRIRKNTKRVWKKWIEI